MTKFLRVFGVQLCLVVLCLVTTMAEPKGPKRSKLSGDFGLTPFLRSGRSNEHVWEHPDVKRRVGKMVMFPRIGRSETLMNDENNFGSKRTGASSGMWFGPRLGRVHKRNDDTNPWTYIILNNEGPIPRQVHYTPRLGRESEEEGYEETEPEIFA